MMDKKCLNSIVLKTKILYFYMHMYIYVRH